MLQSLFYAANVACSIIDDCNHNSYPQGCIPLLPVCTASNNPSQLMDGGIRSPSSKLMVKSEQHINASCMISFQSGGNESRARNSSIKGLSKCSTFVCKIACRTGVNIYFSSTLMVKSRLETVNCKSCAILCGKY